MIILGKVLKISLQDVFKTSWRCLEDDFARRLENILKMSWQDVLKMSWRCLQDVLKVSWIIFARRFEDVLKRSWRHLEDVWLRRIYWSWQRRLQDVFWRRMTKAHMFVLIKTSWRPLEDSFWRRRRKTSSRRLHQDECLVGYVIKIIIQ